MRHTGREIQRERRKERERVRGSERDYQGIGTDEEGDEERR